MFTAPVSHSFSITLEVQPSPLLAHLSWCNLLYWQQFSFLLGKGVKCFVINYCIYKLTLPCSGEPGAVFSQHEVFSNDPGAKTLYSLFHFFHICLYTESLNNLGFGDHLGLEMISPFGDHLVQSMADWKVTAGSSGHC